MPIPDANELLLPVLKALTDGAEHQVEEIRGHMKSQFDVSPAELARTNKSGTSVFVNHVAWALAHLNMRHGPLGHPIAITLVRQGTYKITEHGAAILKSNPSDLSIKDLRQ
jgi:restriction endonuclease Mrr